MRTLGEMKAGGEGIRLYCENDVGARWCNHSYAPSMDQLIQYFGVDYDVYANRGALLSRFVCKECGGRDATLQIIRPVRYEQSGDPSRSHFHQPLVSVEEATRRHHEMMADFRSYGFKTNEEINAETRARIKAERLAARTGHGFIGPPNPYAHRKRGRWL